MKSSIASARNIAPFEILFRHPQLESLALSFLNAFFPFKTVRFETPALVYYHNFDNFGAFEDKVLLKLEDADGKKRFAEIALLELYTDTEILTFTMDEDFLSHTGENGLEDLKGRVFNLLYFAGFKNTSTKDYHQFREFQLTEPPYHIRFDIYGLPEFKTPEAALQTDRDFWLFWLSNNRIPADWTDRLMPLLDQSAWPDEWHGRYLLAEKTRKIRRKQVLPIFRSMFRRQRKERKASVNWMLLEKELGLIANRNIDKNSLNLGAVEKDLAAYAFNYFRQWSETCRKEFPELNLEIESEQLIVEDFRHCLETGILGIFEQDEFYASRCNTGSSGILLALYLNSLLNDLWHYEFIFKQSTDFKSLTALRAIYSWLENYEDVSIKLEKFYEYAIKDQLNLANPDISVPSLYPDQADDDFRTKNVNGIVLSVLENAIKTNRKLISDEKVRFKFYIEEAAIPYGLLEQLLKDNIGLLL